MSTFELWLIGVPAPLRVQLPVATVVELATMVTREKFVVGVMADEDEHGWLPDVLIQSNRIQLGLACE